MNKVIERIAIASMLRVHLLMWWKQ